MANVKAGDLAIVMSDLFPENIGLIVEVVSAAKWGYGDDWNCVSRGRPIICFDPDNGNVFMDMDADFRDFQLRPITGLPIDEETREELTA